jgi:hypothetical protein
LHVQAATSAPKAAKKAPAAAAAAAAAQRRGAYSNEQRDALARAMEPMVDAGDAPELDAIMTIAGPHCPTDEDGEIELDFEARFVFHFPFFKLFLFCARCALGSVHLCVLMPVACLAAPSRAAARRGCARAFTIDAFLLTAASKLAR